VQRPYEIGQKAAQNVARYLTGEKVPPFNFVSHVLLTKANAKEVVPTLNLK
jgi:ribose transport system substrate-binding protein